MSKLIRKKGKNNEYIIKMRYVVPFEFLDNLYDGEESFNFEEKCNEINNEIWQRDNLIKGESDIFDYIVSEFDISKTQDLSNKMGAYWHNKTIENNPIRMKFISKKITNDQNEFDVSICDMGLFIFRSGIGLLWYEIKADDKILENMDGLIEFQNVFKELSRSHSINLKFEEPNQDYITLGELIADLLKELEIKFLAQRTITNNYSIKVDCPDKAVLFTYAAFEQGEEWTDDYKIKTYYLNNGYKQSYKIDNSIIDPVIKTPYTNVLWLATKEGCGYYVWVDDDNKTFFTENFYLNNINEYFLLFIRVLYQSYSLQRYSRYTAEFLPGDYKKYISIGSETERISKSISKIIARVSLFLTKSAMMTVSNIHHQSEFFMYLSERFHIKDDVKSVYAGLDSLNELQHETYRMHQEEREKEQLIIEKEDERKEREAENRLQIVLGLTAILAAISAFMDAYGIISGFSLDKILTFPQMALFIVSIILCIGIPVLVIIVMKKAVKHMIKKK